MGRSGVRPERRNPRRNRGSTGHASIFTQLLNDPQSPQHVPGVRVVAG